MKILGSKIDHIIVDVSKQDMFNALMEYCYNKFKLDKSAMPCDEWGFRELSVYPIRHPKYSKEQKAVVKLFNDLKKMLDI